MDNTSLLASSIFWLSFAFSPGPFWAAWMNYHTQPGSFAIYKVYLSYVFLVFVTQCFVLALMVQYLGQINANILLPLYFVGGGYIIYFAVHSFRMVIQNKAIKFGFKEMTILSLTNPKVYLTVPVGALSAHYFADQVVLNAVIFSLAVMVPICLIGSLFFAMLGKLSAKLLLEKVKYLTAGLLLIYGLYLLYEGTIKLLSRF